MPQDQRTADAQLPAPSVPAAAYDEEYFLHGCAGSDEWRESAGSEVAGIYPGALQRADLRAGEVLVDIGTGRGELLAVAVERGAARAIGVEYSPAAVKLARQTIAAHGIDGRAEVIQADARSIPLEDGVADLVTLLDVVEHLTSLELAFALGEVARLLRPGGRAVLHTMPNRTIFSVTYRVQRLLIPWRALKWPANPRTPYEQLMHVNEQTLGDLRRSLLAAGFAEPRVRLGEWIRTDFVPSERAARTYHRLARIPGLARLGVADIWAEAPKPEAI